MNGLDLFSGIGGISFALREYVRPIAYCENDPYCQAVLLSRMADRLLPNCPIWDDVTTLQGADLRGSPDIIYGGFPCQDISIAGTGRGLEGERSSLFHEIIRISKEIRQEFIFLENVPAITTRGGNEVVAAITEMGYDCRWITITAYSVGALHKRDRWFLLAHDNSKPSGETHSGAEQVEDKEGTRIRFTRQNRGDESRTYWEENKCPFLGMDDGLQFELDRAKALGNAVVPQQTKRAFEILMGLN